MALRKEGTVMATAALDGILCFTCASSYRGLCYTGFTQECHLREFRSSVPSVVCGPAESASSGSFSQMQSLRPRPRPAESESAFGQDFQMVPGHSLGGTNLEAGAKARREKTGRNRRSEFTLKSSRNLYI